MSKEDFGTQILKFRKAQNLTQSDLAIILGVSQPTVGFWESGYNQPKADKKELLLKLMTPKNPETQDEIRHLKETISHQKIIIELLQDKVKGLGGSL
ncbi:XRE family transcriptional regulator [Lacihabitans sp. LS3-19]|uniref:helix-turn-helix domain-containing protein n=1 Tax=Lacihabitans sp. LS3-19 TaxID=2487335 RepID=UPI0020CF22EA|nr:helix-turn-helix transcriptional regulator [Lacihabitans sp. LS3-19]MCP9768996.1 XRE family transcriptional regulator [Lacihabitans sp. LS3-19]